MTEYEKVIEYEIHIEDMLNAFQERLLELEQIPKRTDFEEGMCAAYSHVLDIINTRHKMILEVIADS